MPVKKRALGRGLDSLLGPDPTATATVEPPAAPRHAAEGRPTLVSIDQLSANPFQPRRNFDAQRLDELTASIEEKGILQPLVVRVSAESLSGAPRFEIIAGERRWRAAQKAGLSEVPVLVRAIEDQEMLELALIENLQRDDLDPIEEARAYRQLMEDFQLTQEQVADRVGRSRTAVTNSLRLLRLPEPIQAWIEQRRLSAGHARALLVVEQEPVQMAVARQIMNEGLSVRQTERKVAQFARSRKPRAKAEPPDTTELENTIRERLGLQVRIRAISAQAGRIEINYASIDEFQRFLDHIGCLSEQDV